MESSAEEIVREILFKLPTRDLVRCSCVCKLWRAVVRDDSFRTLHGDARHVVCAEAETLLVPEFRVSGIGLEMTVLMVSSPKPVCRFTDLAGGYGPSNACNGFLLVASGVKDWPVYVCNPVTGEKLKIPAPPKIKRIDWRMYAMGCSPSTGEYKLFRLSFSKDGWPPETRVNHLDVYTLGGGNAGWRPHPHLFPYRAVYGLCTPPPVLLDGKLYVVTERPGNYRAPDRMLVIDVATEAHFTFTLPESLTGEDTAAVHAFELRGRLCVAVHVVGRPQVCFWVMPSLREQRGRRLIKDGNDDEVGWLPGWERRYTFSVEAKDDYACQPCPCAAWLDSSDGMLCYRLGGILYKYDTTKKRPMHNRRWADDSLEWDHRFELAPTPFESPHDLRWNVYGGYRPSLLSPHLAFASTTLLQQYRRVQEDCEQALHHAMSGRQPSKKRCSTRTPDRSNNAIHAAKRICKPTHDS